MLAKVYAGAVAYAVRGGVGRALCDELGLDVAGPAGQPHIWRPDGVWPMARTHSPSTLYLPWDWRGSIIPGEEMPPPSGPIPAPTSRMTCW